MKEKPLKEKRAWIIGAGSGIGAAAARALAGDGAATVLSGRRAEALAHTAAQIEGAGGRAQQEPLDVADAAACNRLAANIGSVDVLVMSAGTNVKRRSLRELSTADWTAVTGTNLGGAFNVVQAVLPGMRERGGGLIIIVSSWIGWRHEPVAGVSYSASKRALGALTETINAEEGASGIRATCLCPAETDTEVLDTRPMPPSAEVRALMLKADDVGRVVAFLASCPPHMCVNEVVVSPAANRFYRQGGV